MAAAKVYVPQEDGEIVFTPGGDLDAQRTFAVNAHLVSPRSNDEQQQLLQLVDGARLATKKDLASAGSATAAGSPGTSKE